MNRATAVTLACLLAACAAPQRKAFASGVQRRFARLYREVVALLDRRHFRPPAHSPLGASGEQPPGPE